VVQCLEGSRWFNIQSEVRGTVSRGKYMVHYLEGSMWLSIQSEGCGTVPRGKYVAQ
jgi:hypothetical protein